MNRLKSLLLFEQVFFPLLTMTSFIVDDWQTVRVWIKGIRIKHDKKVEENGKKEEKETEEKKEEEKYKKWPRKKIEVKKRKKKRWKNRGEKKTTKRNRREGKNG